MNKCEKCGLCKNCGAWNEDVCICEDNYHECPPELLDEKD